MPPILASPISHYGALVVLEGEHHKFTNLDFPSTMFVRYTTVLLVDIGQPNLISYRFVAIFVLMDGQLIVPGVGSGSDVEEQELV